jgi:hypothetical protein
METFFLALFVFLHSFAAEAGVMNPGEAKGELVYLSAEDVLGRTPKYLSLSPLSIPVFAELPLDLAVVAGAITLKQQSLLSHVQIKSRARKTPNLDISDIPGGLESALLRPYSDGDYVHMLLKADGTILLEKSTEEEARAFHASRQTPPVRLVSNLTEKRILRSEDLSWRDFDKVGSKAANYAELARVLNTPERTVVRPGFAIPFYHYSSFLSLNPGIKKAIDRLLRDPLMNRVSDVSYRDQKLKALREMILDESNSVDPFLVEALLALMDRVPSRPQEIDLPNGNANDSAYGRTNAAGMKRKMKFRSSTNAEDLPNFNGAGLYDSEAYKPMRDGIERSREEKEKSLKKALRTVWASIWNLRAYEERSAFGIPHRDVLMGMQINPSFTDEGVDGVVVTKNIAGRADLPGAGVYIESQRGDKYSVANPEDGSHPERALVLYAANDPLNLKKYRIHILQNSNVSDDGATVLAADNPKPVMTEGQLRDLVYQSLRATAHFRRLFGRDRPDFSLDLEFKVDAYDTGKSAVYLKQARPYID